MSDTVLDLPLQLRNPDTEAAELGLQAQYFRDRNAVGRYLVRRAQQERAAALAALAEVDPTDVAAIRALQDQARIPALILDWWDQAIAAGQAAETRIEDAAAGIDPVILDALDPIDTSYRNGDLYA